MRRRAVLLLTVMTAFLLAVASPAWAAEFTVNSTGDGGDNNDGNGSCFTGILIPGDGPGTVQECTLRAAIEEADANNNDATVVDLIKFSIPGGGPHTISPDSSLPLITEPVIIDGYTQPGASENTRAVGSNADLRIILDGSDAGLGTTGLNITANDSVVRGLSVTRFSASAGLTLSGADNNRIEGNLLGTGPGGTQDLGNAWGLVVQRHFSDPTNHASDNTIGGISPETRNIISHNSTGVRFGSTNFGTRNNVQGNHIALNDQDGVEIAGAGSTGNSILGNSIFSNGGLGIDLDPNGPTANDPGDTDTGANNLQNKPKITSAKPTMKNTRKFTTIRGTLNSTPSTPAVPQTFTIQLFRNLSGEDEGRILLTQFPSKTTDADGNASFDIRVPRSRAPVGSAITATATNNSTGDTSEFSAAKTVR